jgi:hypothetical protein
MSSKSISAGSGSRPANLKSGVWEHFIRDSVRQVAQCTICKASLKIGGGSTKSLHTHLQTKHDINVLKGKPAADSGSDDDGNGAKTANISTTTDVLKPSKHKNSKPAGASGSIMKYIFKPNDCSLAATVARMTACDGLPFRVFTTSTDMRRWLLRVY